MGERELCSGDRCAFWEDDTPTDEPPCTIERLRIPLELDGLARHLLELRLRLEEARDEVERRDSPRRYAELLNLNRE